MYPDLPDTRPLTRILVEKAADLLTISSVCPACGYPTLEMGLCAYCRPLIDGAPAAMGFTM